MDKIISVSLPGSTSVIFPAELVPDYLDYSEPGGPSWTPSQAQVLEAEQRLRGYLASATPQLPASLFPGAAQRIAEKLDRYARQYLGVSRAERRLLYINCFPADIDFPWQTELVEVEDGGESYFHLLYDPELKEFSELYVNGQA